MFLEKDNQYFCEGCNSKVDAVKGIRIKSLPKIITFQLNRFDLDLTSFVRKKINNKVTFPYILDMNEFLKEYDEIKLSSDKEQVLYKTVCSLMKEQECSMIDTYNPRAGIEQDLILRNLNKGSNTYEGFEDKNKQKKKMYDEFSLKV